MWKPKNLSEQHFQQQSAYQKTHNCHLQQGMCVDMSVYKEVKLLIIAVICRSVQSLYL